MAKRRDTETQEFPGMEVPKDLAVERASRAYRKTIAERLEVQKREATQKAKVGELVLKWAETNNIKPKVERDDKGKEVERYVYTRGNVEAEAERPLRWNIHVRLDDEIEEPEPEGGEVAPDDDPEPEP